MTNGPGAQQRRWESLEKVVRLWWDGDLRSAQEPQLRDPELNGVWYLDDQHREAEAKGNGQDTETLLFLPHPYISAGGSEDAFPEMYCWDIYFINKALLQHGRTDIVRNHIANHLFMIERYGMVLNGNRTYYRTRSQTPLLALSVQEYYHQTSDRELLMVAYPLLKQEYQSYWTAPHHQTPTGLATNRDLGDPSLRKELAAEAECLDFTPCFGGNITACNPVQTNAALVRYARALQWMAEELGWPDEAEVWRVLADARAEKIRELNWDPVEGFYFEYNFEWERRMPYWSLGGYWALWAGVATKTQAAQMVKQLGRFEHPHGLAQTDIAYPSPHPEFSWLQWGYPCGWPPQQMIVVEGLDDYGFHEHAGRVAFNFVTLLMDIYEKTGKFWEKYNVVEGSVDLPRERTAVVPLHGWTTAALAVLGQRAFRPREPWWILGESD